MSGMLRVIMKPLISQIPLFGGIQIFFLNSPSVDFNLIGVVDVLDMPGLKYIHLFIIILASICFNIQLKCFTKCRTHFYFHCEQIQWYSATRNY
jgi:hypothetical protein